MISHNNLYDPIMYLIEKYMKRQINAGNGGPTGETGSPFLQKQYIEGYRLERDAKGRLYRVEGWEYIDITLNFAPDGLLESVDAVNKLTGKHLQIRLIYDSKKLLVEVEPEIIDAGTGEQTAIDLPDVFDDYYAEDPTD
jgi:hypothetical protein